MSAHSSPKSDLISSPSLDNAFQPRTFRVPAKQLKAKTQTDEATTN